MKNRIHIVLLAGFFASLMLYVLFFLGRTAAPERTSGCLMSFFLRCPRFLSPVVAVPAGICPLDPLALPLRPVPCGPDWGSLLIGTCGRRLGHFGRCSHSMLVHCPGSRVRLGVAGPWREALPKAGHGGAGRPAGGLCGTEIRGRPRPFSLRFELMDLSALAILAAGAWLLLRKKGLGKRTASLRKNTASRPETTDL